MPRVVPLLCGAALIVAASQREARAQDASASAADALFQSGRAAMARADYDVACAQFHESFRLQATVGALLNGGACEEKRGHFALALQSFRDALALLGAGDYRRAYAEEHLAALRPRVARTRLVLDGPPPAGLSIAQDDVALSAASLDIEFFVDPGEHVYAASAPGFESESVKVRLAEGEQRRISFHLRLATRVGHAPPPSMVVPWTLVGTGAALAVAGGVFGLVVMGAANDVRDHCDGSGCDRVGLDAAHRGRPYAVLSPVLLATGAALAGSGAVWLVLSHSSRVQPSLAASPTSIDASLRGTF